MTGAQVVILARRWIGTPYVHQASVRGAGCDCLGLVRGVWRELYGQEPASVPAYSRAWSEASGDERLWAAAKRYLVAADADIPQAGDVLLFRMRSNAVAKHLGIQAGGTERPSFIHAYSGHAVMESALSEAWSRRIVARFRFPEGA